MAITRERIAELALAALAGDWHHAENPALVSVMGRSALTAKDVPAASEMAALLHFFADESAGFSGRTPCPLRNGGAVELVPGLVWDEGKLVLLIDVAAGNLPLVASWCVDGMQSANVKGMPGILALAFTVERPAGDEGVEVLFPEWFCVFYPHANPENAFPILALQSVMENPAFGSDWVNAAVGRMAYYGLPREQAEWFVNKGVKPL